MKTAVVYYSLSGNVRYAAEKAAEALGADLIPLSPIKAYPDSGFRKFFWGGKAATMRETPDLETYSFTSSGYDTVVLCSPVWAGTFTPPLRTFLKENDLTGKKIAVIACSSGGSAEKCIEQLRRAAKAESLVSSLSLVDPKDRPSEENERRIKEFADKLKS